jgi:hypothetical protein
MIVNKELHAKFQADENNNIIRKTEKYQQKYNQFSKKGFDSDDCDCLSISACKSTYNEDDEQENDAEGRIL